MLNKNKALTNFISGYVMSIAMIVLFITLGQTNNNWIGNGQGIDTSTLSGITFGISFVVLLCTYTLVTLMFSTAETAKKTPLPLFLVSLAMSLTDAFAVGVLDTTPKWVDGAFDYILLTLFVIAIFALVWFIQEFNTKFTMATIALNRADEWEFANFLNLSFNRIGVEHKSNFTILTYKGKNTIVSFIPEDVIERKSFLSGELKDKVVTDIESQLKEDEKGLIVYLSNNLPLVEGVNERVSVIPHSDLFATIKRKKK